MASKIPAKAKDVDRFLKALLVISRTTQQILESRAVESAIDKSLSSSKVQILRLLGTRGGQMASQVARFLGVSKPAVTQIIDSMVKAKIVSRKTAKTSRREVTLTLTAKGTKQFRAIQQRQRHLLKIASRSAPKAGVQAWVETLWSISESLTQADRSFQHVCLQCGAHEDGSCVLIGGGMDCLFLLQEDAPKKKATTRRRRTTVKA